LMDDSTGAVSSLMDGTYLTRVRTGAVAGAATDLLARRDSRVFALFGAGGQAAGQLEAVLTVRDIELAKVYCRTFEKAEAFARAMSEKFAGRFNTKIVAVHSPEEAIADADVITAATTAASPVFDGRLLKPGAHVNGIGSFTYDMVEIDSYTARSMRTRWRVCSARRATYFSPLTGASTAKTALQASWASS